jgi:hypothetical protein
MDQIGVTYPYLMHFIPVSVTMNAIEPKPKRPHLGFHPDRTVAIASLEEVVIGAVRLFTGLPW